MRLLNASGCLDALTAPDVARSFDAFVTKTVTPLPREGNAPVRIAEDNCCSAVPHDRHHCRALITYVIVGKRVCGRLGRKVHHEPGHIQVPLRKRLAIFQAREV